MLLVNLLAALNFANVFFKIKKVWKIEKKHKNVFHVCGLAEVVLLIELHVEKLFTRRLSHKDAKLGV